MITIKLTPYLAQLPASDQFQRQVDVETHPTGALQKLMRDRIPSGTLTWGTFTFENLTNQSIRFVVDGAQLLSFYSDRGLLMVHQGTVCLIPVAPRLIVADEHMRIQSCESLGW